LEITPINEYWRQLLSSGETVYAGLIYRLPPRLWRPLVQVQNDLKSVDSRHVYASPSTFHVSVKGLGFLPEELDRNRFEMVFLKISKILSEFKPFEFRLRGLDVFPTALYAKVEDGGNFKAINKRLAEELKGEIEVSPYDAEEFVPHVTLATFNTRDVSQLLGRALSEGLQDMDFGSAGVYEIEATRVNLLVALGPQETQDGAFSYIRSFWLGKFSSR
jgi:2'-5' RNA ligase